MEKKSVYIIASQAGGGEKSDRFTPVFWEFKKILENEFESLYSDVIKELSIIFRIDGKFSNWGVKGINRMRLMKSQNYITIDIGVTEDVLDSAENEIWNFVWLEFEKATSTMLEKLKKSKVEFNFEEFQKDFNSFKESHFGNIPS